MRQLTTALFATLGLGIAGLAQAEDCDASQAAMNRCASAELTRLDRKLNETYKTQLAWLQNAQRKRDFTSAQRQWIAFRDADCLYQAGKAAEGGSLWPLQQARCLVEHTEGRLRQLEAYVACRQEGCPR